MRQPRWQGPSGFRPREGGVWRRGGGGSEGQKVEKKYVS